MDKDTERLNRSTAILELIADFRIVNNNLSEDLRNKKTECYLAQETKADYLKQIRDLEHVLRTLKADLNTAIHEGVTLDTEDIRKLLMIVNEGLKE